MGTAVVMNDEREHSGNDKPDDRPRDDSAREGADLEPAGADRPGGPGQAGGNIVAPGQVSPAADVGEAPEPDEAVQARQAHLKDAEAEKQA